VGVQERLYMTEPGRATCLARVERVEGDWFVLNRALFAPRSRACRHPQYADEGTLWWAGEKRRLHGVQERAEVWYRLRGTVPTVGAELQCQLVPEVRDLASRAHTGMHLLLHALAGKAPPMVADPEVKGGGHARLTFARPLAPAILAAALQRVRSWIAADATVTRSYATKEDAARVVMKQEFHPPDPVPGPAVLPVVEVVGVGTLPCDGTHVARAGRVGSLVISHAQQGAEGFVVVARVGSPRLF
jgi:Ser-tRNA(Ala) deacylase AlaX